VYLEPWHADIFDWLELRKNHGKVMYHGFCILPNCASVIIWLFKPFVFSWLLSSTCFAGGE
jgi:hypothetical protein